MHFLDQMLAKAERVYLIFFIRNKRVAGQLGTRTIGHQKNTKKNFPSFSSLDFSGCRLIFEVLQRRQFSGAVLKNYGW